MIVIRQHIVYGQAIGDEKTMVQGVAVDIRGMMRPITLVTTSGPSVEDCDRVFNLFAENWRQWGYKIVISEGVTVYEIDS